jgi:alcohol dehydrogenase class IV
MHYLPTRIIYSDKAVRKGFIYLNALGKKALLVTGKSSAQKSGALADVLAVLDSLKIENVLYDKVEENPTLETVMEGAKLFALNNCDFVIGIGGGSPIDTAKAISLTSANNLDIEHIYDTASFKKVYPIVAIPTTAGTGTEVTQYSVLTDASKLKKAGFGHDLAFPSLALVDPAYTLSLPYSVTLNTAIDALSHLLEGLYSNKRMPMIYPLIYQGISLIYNNLRTVLNDLADIKGRDALMKASVYGGITISHTSTTLQHSIGYPLTSLFNVPHGLANGIVMKQVMELYYPAVEQELTELFTFLGINKPMFFDWLDSFELIFKGKITPEFIEEKIPEVLTSRNMANNPLTISAEDIRSLYQSLM